MKIGIVGLPNVGKSTLFQALTKCEVDTSNYPFATIEPNVGVVTVPDERLEKLAQISSSEKIIPTIVEFVDIAGLVKGASKGEGLGNQFLHNIREVDAILEVVRAFEKDDVTHIMGKIDPKRDMDIIMLELILKDIDTVIAHIPKIEKELRGAGKEGIKKIEEIQKTFESLKQKLENETPAYQCNEKEIVAAKSINLLTAKPFMYVINGDAEKINLSDFPEHSLAIDIKDELELNSLSSAEIEELGMKSGLDRIIKQAYEILGLISFFTTGEDETRAWTINNGSTAKQAGGAIHSDFEEKFIRASVIFWKELIDTNGYAKARDTGLLRLEGKDYIVKDGDVIEFKI